MYKLCNVSSETCRLCRSVGDVKYLKHFYNKANVGLLSMAEALYGGKLPKKDLQSLSNLDFGDIIEEMKTSCPVTYKVLSVMIKEQFNREKKIAPLC